VSEVKFTRSELRAKNLDRQLNNLIIIYGVKAIQEAVARVVPPPSAGRTAIDDLAEFGLEFERDARDWLAGRKLRTSRSLAINYAAINPGHSEISTFERVYRKLREKRDLHILDCAWRIASRECTPDKLIEALTAIHKIHPIPHYLKGIEWVRADVENFRRGIPFHDPDPLYSTITEKLEQARPRSERHPPFISRMRDLFYNRTIE
jgi:hypothetical protein